MQAEQIAELIHALKDIYNSRLLSGKLSITGLSLLPTLIIHKTIGVAITLTLYDWCLSFSNGKNSHLRKLAETEFTRRIRNYIPVAMDLAESPFLLR